MRLLTLSQVLQAYPRSKSSLYREIDLGLFPQPVKVGVCRRNSLWPADEIDVLVHRLVGGLGVDDQRQLVQLLEKKRGTRDAK